MLTIILFTTIIFIVFVNRKKNNTKLETLIYGSKRSNTIGLIFFAIVLMFFLWIIIITNPYSMILFLIFSLLVIISSLYKKSDIKKFIGDLDKNMVDIIESELEKPLVQCDYYYALTDSYVIKATHPCAILKYEDIILMYKKGKFGGYRNHGLEKYLVLVTKDNRRYEFLISTTLLTLNYKPVDFSDVIKSKNDDVLFGNTEENKNIVKQKYGIELE